MRVKQIAALVLLLYAAVSVGVIFHDHLSEQPGKHCNVCQTLHSSGYVPSIATYAPILIVQGSILPALQIFSKTLLVSPYSQRAPPTF